LLSGKPLIAYTIEVALQAKGIDHVVVSTEDPEIAEITCHYGASVPFTRPKHLARSDSNLNDVINHVHHGLKAIWDFPERYILITMLPTSPFRSLEMVEALVSRSIDGYNATTVKRVQPLNRHFYEVGSEGLLQPLSMPVMDVDGDMRQGYFKNLGLLLATNWGYPIGRPSYLHVIEDPISMIDIDTWVDFYLAESVIREGLFDFGY
jgi:hypothetical protein